MACTSWLHLHSTSLTRVFIPIPHHPTALSTAFLHRLNRFTSPPRFTSSLNQTNPQLTPVHAQAKRGFLSKDDEVASMEDLRFDSPLKIVEYPDPILRKRNKRIDTFDENLKKLVDEMFDVMYKTDGIGLSAPQVGVNVQLMVFNPVGERGEGQEIVLGILFFDRMTGEVLDSIRAQLEALEKKYEDTTGLPSPEKVETQKRKKAAAGFGKS
ncbi:Peptide deformylase - like 1 [Theobroma cacao]|nr:Peptide deformylase - like 1 [Theobroma cacao]